MNKIIYKIDENGFYLLHEDADINDNEIIPSGYTDKIPAIEHDDGTVEGLLKPKWTGSTWIEGATQEDIDASKETFIQSTEPGRIDFLEQAVNDLILGGIA